MLHVPARNSVGLRSKTMQRLLVVALVNGAIPDCAATDVSTFACKQIAWPEPELLSFSWLENAL
jgi:hypothetical protein